ncbi:hypothetical protein PV11_05113 [Exophiala sideris]|uniref:Zn(2)-C6 fungal-type domain-containing protein n=1 Tax=Exophiala sideris TaxID=1016849 RepID=A0A0D1Z8I9_9EURO|nr:hypothetical protein PV11_05113 [Exophiala sideris]
MPGVPSGRGCDQCRQQKKKCDISAHPCARCKRLKLPCINLGQKRFKFVSSTSNEDKSPPWLLGSPAEGTSRSGSTASSSRSTSAGIQSGKSQGQATLSISPVPTNAYMRLVNVFTDKIKPAAGIRYNISWTFGSYLDQVPAHLGVNEALDAAADAFMVGMRRFPNPDSAVDLAPVMLEKYTFALASLRRCLDDPAIARAPETLCAVLFLLNCQQFMWHPTGTTTSHGEGAAQIIKLRGHPEQYGPFEGQMLLALRGVVLLESLFNDRIYFTDQEWVDMFASKTAVLAPEGLALQSFTRLANIMRRARIALQDVVHHATELDYLRTEAARLRADLEPFIVEARQRLGAIEETADAHNSARNIHLNLVHCHYLRTYAFGLALVLVVNEVRIAMSPDPANVMAESQSCAVEILRLAQLANQYRPLGACVLKVCLIAAEIAASDLATQLAAKQMRLEYHTDFRSLQQCDFEEPKLICGRAMSPWLASTTHHINLKLGSQECINYHA